MAEHKRTKTYQFCDAERYIVIDTITGETQRASGVGNAVMTLPRALEYVANKVGFESRSIVVKLDCIAGFKLNRGGN